MEGNASEIQQKAWSLALKQWAQEDPGHHLEFSLLQDYARNAIGDADTVVAIRRHLSRCDACLREAIRLEETWMPSVIEVSLRALRWIGANWLQQPITAAAKTPDPSEARLEQGVAGEYRLDVIVTPDEQLLAVLSRAGAAVSGWKISLERLAGDGSTVAVDATGVTDENGRTMLGPARREAAAGETFRVVAERPDPDANAP